MDAARERNRLGVRLAVWSALILAWTVANFAATYAAKPRPQRTPEFFKYSLGIGGLVLYAILLLIVLAIASGLPLRPTLALRRPRSIPRAIGLVLLVIAGTLIIGAIVSPFLHPGDKQEILPERGWVPGHVTAFVLSTLAVAVAAPIVEELLFRGLGFRLLLPFGRGAAIVGVGVAFGLAHGIPEALPILVPLGSGLAWIRDRTNSIYPGIVLHSLFNGVQVVAAVV